MSSEQRTSSGVNLKTLLIAAAASATAALIVPMIWKPGTVFAAAMTPVIVAIVSELLKRPVDTVSAVAVRRAPGGAAILDPPQRKQQDPSGAAILDPRPPKDEPFDPLAPPPTEELEALPEESTAPRAEHRRRPLTARQWKLALATGLIAFAAVVVFFTASELVTGNDVGSGGGRTTFFGGSSSNKSVTDKQDSESKKDKNKSEETTSTPTPSATESPEPSASPTTTASPTQTPAPSAAPNAAPNAVSPEASPAEPAP